MDDFQLLLNDALIDLDKEFTVEVNGKAYKEKRERNLNFMVDGILLRFDPSYLFPVQYGIAVPKGEGENGTGGGK